MDDGSNTTTWVLFATALGMIVWGVADLWTGSSLAGGALGMPREYSARDTGPLFYLLALGKVALGVAMIVAWFKG